MSMSFKASPDGTYGEILVNGQVVAKLPVSGNAVIPGLVGTVSQSGGIPTGAVVERGSNANGEYVRFADGTQICFLATTLISHTANIDLVQNWPFPAEFAQAPISMVGVRVAGTTNEFTQLKAQSGSTTASATTRTTFSTSQDYGLNHTAIGRWY